MKTAIVYDRVNKWGGAERVLLALHELYPEAPLFTAVYSSKNASWAKVFPDIFTTFVQKLPFAKERHELFPYLMPIAFETLDLGGYDLVISVTSEAAKGVITRPDAVHICYLLTPTRYLWSGYADYFKGATFKLLAKPVISYLRRWDRVAARRPDFLIAISNAVKNRIKKYYGLNSSVIYPPVNTSQFNYNKAFKKEDYFLVVARLVAYKKTDLAIAAFNELKLPLIIVGKGSDERRLKRMAKRNIRFVGELKDKELTVLYEKARGLIFPQEEDFGIVVLEAQAAGTPAVAFRDGGALDTVIEGKTGIFFDRQNKKSLVEAVKKFNQMTFDKEALKVNASEFSKENFQKKFAAFVSEVLADKIK